MGNPQTPESEEKRQINVFTLEYQVDKKAKIVLHFPVGLMEYSMDEPARNEAQQTLAAQYVELWGPGFKRIRIKGHTGFGVNSPAPGLEELDGYQAFDRLRTMYRTYLDATKANLYAPKGQTHDHRLVFRAWEENEHWLVIPAGEDAFRRDRNAEKPLLFPFSLSLIGVLDLTKGEDTLDQSFIMGPSLADTLANLGVTSPDIQSWAAKLDGVNQGAAQIAARARAAVTKIDSTVSKVKAVGTAAVAFAGVGALQQETRSIMRSINSTAGLPVDAAIGLSRSLRGATCALGSLKRLGANDTTGLNSKYKQAYDAITNWRPC